MHQKQSSIITIAYAVAVLAAFAPVSVLPVQGARMLH
jgi:hypothetical protein